MGSESKRRKKEKEIKMKSVKKYFKALKKEVLKEFEGRHDRRKRCKKASELVKRRLEMMDSTSSESSPKKLEKTANITPLDTKPAREQMENNTVADDTSVILISDSSPTKQESKLRTSEHYVASTIDKLTGLRKVPRSSLQSAKDISIPSLTSRECQVNGDETLQLKNKGHLQKLKKLRKRKKLQRNERTRTLNRDEEYIGRSRKAKKDQLSIVSQQLKMKQRQRIQSKVKALKFRITDVKESRSTPDNQTTEEVHRKLDSAEHNGPVGKIVVIDGTHDQINYRQLQYNYNYNYNTENDEAFVNGEVHYVDNDTMEKSSPSSGVVNEIPNHHNGEVEDKNGGGNIRGNQGVAAHSFEYEDNNYTDFNDERHHRNYVNEAHSREYEGEYYSDWNDEIHIQSDGRFQNGETHSPEYEDNEYSDSIDERHHNQIYRNGETHTRENVDNYLNGEFDTDSYEYDERNYDANDRNGEKHSRAYEINDYSDSINGRHHSSDYRNGGADSHENEDKKKYFGFNTQEIPNPCVQPLQTEIDDYDLTIPYLLRTIIDESTPQSPQQSSLHQHQQSPSTANDSLGQYENDERSCSLSSLSLSEFSVSSESFNKSTQLFKSTISNKVLLLVKTKMYFHGALTMRLLSGNAGIFGYLLQRYEKITAHSLTAFGFLNISPRPSLQRVEHIENKNDHLKELSKYFFPSDFRIILSDFNSATDAIIELENDSRNNSIAMIEKYTENNIVPIFNTIEESDQLYENFLRCKFLEHTDRSLYVNDQWREIEMSMISRQIIIGGKGVGKSTLIRYLINKNLAEFPKILLIDVDVGQPETFLPQTVSATIITKPLLGPGFLKNITPLKSYFFSHVDIGVSPLEYFKCVLKLLKYCRYSRELRSMPWIVNTATYTQSAISLEITAGIIRELNPTDLIQIADHDPTNNLEIILSPGEINNYSCNFLNEEVKNQNNKCLYKMHVITTVLQRDHLALRDDARVELQLAAILSRLNNKMPWNASLSNVKPTVCASLELLRMSMHNDIVAVNSNIINGNLCYLCQSTDDGFLECHGIGLVKGIDTIANKVYLWPSLSGMELRNINILGICVVPVPQLMLIKQCSRSTNSVPYIYREENFEMVQQRFLQANNIFKYYNSNV